MSSSAAPDNQYETAKQTKGDVIPGGASPILYKVNSDKSLTPNTMGYTTSKNQLTTSGK